MPEDRPSDPTAYGTSPGSRGSARWIDPRIDTQPQPIVPPVRRPGQPAQTAAPQQAPAGPPTPRYYTVPSATPPPRPARRPRWWVFHLVAAALMLFLTLGMFAFGMIASSHDPTSEYWIAPVAIAWLLAIVLVPVWIVWSIFRGILWRSRA